MEDNSTLCMSPFIECFPINIKTQKICAKACDRIRECTRDDESRKSYGCDIHFDVTSLTASEHEKSFHSPNYPRNYHNDERRVWHIRATDGFQLQFRFDNFQLERRCYDLCVIFNRIMTEDNLRVRSDFPCVHRGFPLFVQKILLIKNLKMGPVGKASKPKNIYPRRLARAKQKVNIHSENCLGTTLAKFYCFKKYHQNFA